MKQLKGRAHNCLKSPLLRLPAEIRNRIYHYIYSGLKAFVFDPRPLIFMIFDVDGAHVHAVRCPVKINISAVSRQLRHEVQFLVFKYCVFNFSSVFHTRVGGFPSPQTSLDLVRYTTLSSIEISGYVAVEWIGK
ncbi:hypothetical protein NX059_008887 [Plenodomus lindquistii]|nr:hypothetical protein NX059_008887 [Plenodomus lindquistii]